MSSLQKIERKYSWIAIPNLTIYIIIGQVLAYALTNDYWGNANIRDTMTLIPGAVMKGEVWRLFSFIFIPPVKHPIFMLIGWYMFYFIGGSLEGSWGAFKYTMYMLIGFLSVLLFSFLVGFAFGIPNLPITNALLGSSIFLAFACLFPEFEVRIYFILPVKVKWMGYLLAGFVILGLLVDPLPFKILTLAGLLNFILFFWKDLFERIKNGERQRKVIATKKKEAGTPFHVCSECGATDLTHPEREFRYRNEMAVCSDCVAKAQKNDSSE